MVTSSSVRPLAWKLSTTLVCTALGEGVAVLVQLAQGLGGRVAAQRADDLGFQEVADLLGVEGAFTKAAGGGEQILLAAADVCVQLGHHVDPDLVGREHRLTRASG